MNERPIIKEQYKKRKRTKPFNMYFLLEKNKDAT